MTGLPTLEVELILSFAETYHVFLKTTLLLLVYVIISYTGRSGLTQASIQTLNQPFSTWMTKPAGSV